MQSNGPVTIRSAVHLSIIPVQCMRYSYDNSGTVPDVQVHLATIIWVGTHVGQDGPIVVRCDMWLVHMYVGQDGPIVVRCDMWLVHMYVGQDGHTFS